MYIKASLSKYLNDLSSKLPAPGGGSVAALTGALGVSLISMVLQFTIGKDKFKQFEKELKKAQRSIDDLRKKLSALVDEDIKVYKKVSKAFKSHNKAQQKEAIKNAASVPLEICNCTYEAMQLCLRITKKTNINLISDIAVAAELLEAAHKSAYYNVRINLKFLQDKNFSAPIRHSVELQEKEMYKVRKEIINISIQEF